MALTDLADAYLHVPVDAVHQRFLRFAIERLAFSVSMSALRAIQGSQDLLEGSVGGYLGVEAGRHSDISLLRQHLVASSLKKSASRTCDPDLQHTGVLEYLGVQFNMLRGCVCLPQRKIREIQNKTKVAISK